MEIFKAIASVMKEIGPIGKNQRNLSQNFNFRGIDDVYNFCQPIMAKHGVFTVPTILSFDKREFTSVKGTAGIHVIAHYQFTFYAQDGSSIVAQAIGEGMDYGDKAFNKAASIAHKYALLQTFCIPTKDLVDPDSESHEVRPASDVMPLGKHKGKRMDDVSKEDLNSAIVWCESTDAEKFKDLILKMKASIAKR